MRRIRSHVDADLQPGATVALPEDARAHLTRVLRLREGDPVVLFNGDGHDYPARLIGAGPRASAEILAREPALAAEAALTITLVQALARGEKMDWIIQKATELGVARIVPVVTQRSEVRLDGERADRRLAHWRKVAIGACEQCGRARVPEIAPPRSLHAAIETLAEPLRIALDPDGDGRLADLPSSPASALAFAVGPEGGFDDHELAAFGRAGWRRLRLGARILRTETAGMAAIAALLALAGDL